MKEDLKERISNYPKMFYHGTDLRFVSLSEEVRKGMQSYCCYLREVLCRRFSPYYDLGDKDHKRLKELLGESIDREPKILENLVEGMADVMMSKKSEDYEYGAFYITSNIFYAHMYAEKAFAGGEFAFAAYALAKAAKEAGLQKWYLNDELGDVGKVVDTLILVAEKKPMPVIFKLPDIEPEYLRTEQNESIEKYIQNGKLNASDFRYSKQVNLLDYDYYIVDEEFKNKLYNDEFE